MASIVLKELPAELHRRLQARARANHRSMAAELRLIIEQALDDRAGSPSIDEIDRLRVRGDRPLTQDIIDAARNEGRP